MTDLTKLHVETEALATFGRERCEDAISFHLMNGLIRDVLNISPKAFGTFPEFSGRYYNIWTQLKDARTDECSIVRDQLWKQGVGLIDIAAAYENTDIEAALDFDSISQNMDAYVETNKTFFESPHSGMTGDFIADNPSCPNYTPTGLAAEIPDDLAAISALDRPRYTVGPVEVTWKVVYRKSGRLVSEVESIHRDITLDPGCENDKLHEYLTMHLDTLAKADAFFEVLSPGEARPLSDIIARAYAASPTIIKARAEVMYKVAASIDLIAEEMRGAVFNLSAQWWGNSGASSINDVGTGAPSVYYVMADVTLRYLETISKICRWQAKRGVDLHEILQNVRGSYANAILERVSDLIDVFASYASTSVGFVSTSEEDVRGAISGFIDALNSHAQGNINLMMEYLEIDKERWSQEADFDGVEAEFIEPKKFPLIHGGDSWMDADGWEPKPDHPSDFRTG